QGELAPDLEVVSHPQGARLDGLVVIAGFEMKPAAICREVGVHVVLRVWHEIGIGGDVERPGIHGCLRGRRCWTGARRLAGCITGEQNQRRYHHGECASRHYPPRSTATPTSASPMATIARPKSSRLALA